MPGSGLREAPPGRPRRTRRGDATGSGRLIRQAIRYRRLPVFLVAVTASQQRKRSASAGSGEIDSYELRRTLIWIGRGIDVPVEGDADLVELEPPVIA